MKYKLGLLAKDIHNSVLPRTYAFFGDDIGVEIDFTIFNIPEEQLQETVRKMRETLNGFTVTMPYKVKIMEHCDELDESAEKCGSANTVLVKDGKLIGYNTDGWGLMKSLGLKGIDFSGKRVALVGAGGVALSIAYNLLINGVEHVDVLNVFEDETRRLVDKMGERFTGFPLNSENLNRCAAKADVFINASVLGQVGYADYEDLGFLRRLPSDAVVFDVNYSNPNAKLPQTASKMGLRSYIGNTMSSCQGIRAMEIWTGTAPSDEAARELVAQIESGT